MNHDILEWLKTGLLCGIANSPRILHSAGSRRRTHETSQPEDDIEGNSEILLTAVPLSKATIAWPFAREANHSPGGYREGSHDVSEERRTGLICRAGNVT